MPKTYFTSDQHFFHKRLLETYSNRPFPSVDAMNKALIQRFNAVVQPEDTVYMLGDFSWGNIHQTKEILAQLKGNLHYIPGNHDKLMTKPAIKEYFKSFSQAPYLEIKVEDPTLPHPQKIILSHYPILEWNSYFRGAWHLYGHCHGTVPDDNTKRCLDVGVDCWNFTPVEYQTIKHIMLNVKKVPEPPEGHMPMHPSAIYVQPTP